jgi:chromosome segregation ATPase
MVEFDRAMVEANNARTEALAQAAKDLKDALVEAANDYKESLNEIEEDFKKRIAELGKLSADLAARQKIVQGQIDSAQGNIPSLTQQIADATKAQAPVAPKQTAPTININVKTDPAQNAAQTGKKIAKVVQKYTAAGGISGGGIARFE